MPVTRVIHGSPFATCTQKVLFAAYEADVSLKGVTVDMMNKEHKRPEYLENMQPFGVIPVYEELDANNVREFKIYESRAICRYINTIGNGTLVPKEPRAYGLFEQFATTEVDTTDPIVSKIVYQRVFSPKYQGKEADEEIVKSQIEPLRTSLGVLNKQLKSTQNYIVGDFSLVDIFYTPLLQHLSTTPEWKIVEEYPEVVAWFKRVTSRPNWKKALETRF